MKKEYVAPSFEVELYRLDMAIASNCHIVVTNGPALGGHELCEDYKDPFPMNGLNSTKPYNVNFYEDTNCQCYTTGGIDTGYWTS